MKNDRTQQTNTADIPTTTTSTKKVSLDQALKGSDGQNYLSAGESVALRHWAEQPKSDKPMHSNDYETVGFVLSGTARLYVGDDVIELEPGDSWCVPAGADHSYSILTPFEAIEATSPPARRS
jgi:quercetin dioxygenase-like cupin family protein